MGQFDLGWVGEYVPKLVATNDFLNEKLENDTYGIYYSVLFEGDADTFLLQAKKPPVEGEAEYGMIEMSKSGKSKRFKRVKREGGETHSKTQVADYEPSTNARWAIGMAYRAFIQVTGTPEAAGGEFPFEAVKQHATALLKMFDEVKDSGSPEDNPRKEIKEVLPPAAEPSEPAIKQKLAEGFGEPYEAEDGYER